ncbi:LPXTG cell wall anchor domain-containing protein [Sporichthya polymorpha]|uniref:LPXTG cell wall anchor domain-containing protein n=1 Tax=Sporichthya polymorpha TaxID=35751 RepID=UPI0009FF5AEB|nr:LPXTG cell wall anchor domain-containing protein [Sporichthya polymorpha]
MSVSLRGAAVLAPAVAAGALLFGATAATAAPYLDEPVASASDTNPEVGGSVTLNLDGYEPLEQIGVDVHSKVVRVATVRADAQGAATVTVRMPAGFTCEHYIESTGLTSGLVTRVNIVIGDPADCRDADAPGEDDGTDLPKTGAAVGGLAAAGAFLTLGGVALVRRRRSS